MPHVSPYKWDDARMALVRQCLSLGVSVKDLAHHFGVTRARMNQVLLYHHLRPAVMRPTPMRVLAWRRDGVDLEFLENER